MDEDGTCPFCYGTGKMKTKSYLTDFFDNTTCIQPLDMEIKYTINTSVGDRWHGKD